VVGFPSKGLSVSISLIQWAIDEKLQVKRRLIQNVRVKQKTNDSKPVIECQLNHVYNSEYTNLIVQRVYF